MEPQNNSGRNCREICSHFTYYFVMNIICDFAIVRNEKEKHRHHMNSILFFIFHFVQEYLNSPHRQHLHYNLLCSKKESFRSETGPEFPQNDKNAIYPTSIGKNYFACFAAETYFFWPLYYSQGWSLLNSLIDRPANWVGYGIFQWLIYSSCVVCWKDGSRYRGLFAHFFM